MTEMDTPLPNWGFEGYIDEFTVKAPLTIRFYVNISDSAWSFLKRLKGKLNCYKSPQTRVHFKKSRWTGKESLMFEVGKRGRVELDIPFKKGVWYSIQASIGDGEINLQTRMVG